MRASGSPRRPAPLRSQGPAARCRTLVHPSRHRLSTTWRRDSWSWSPSSPPRWRVACGCT